MKNTNCIEELKKEFDAYAEMYVPEGLDREEQLRMYSIMWVMRKFEEAVKPLWMANKVHGYYHPYITEEAIATGIITQLKRSDYVGSTHRGHGHLIAKGGDINKMMAELFGKEEGYNKGRGGSMHISDMSIGMLGATGIVGAATAPAVGSALKSWIKGTDDVTVVFFGDGGANAGSISEAMNMAAAWKLPVVFVCENNQWAIATDFARVTGEQDLYKRGIGFGIPSCRVDGYNIYQIWDTAKTAIARARAGEGPSFIECKTMRMLGHHATDDSWYRDMTVCDKYWEIEPIKRMGEFLVENKIATPEELEAIEAEAIKQVEASIDYADTQCHEPSLDTFYDYIYADGEVIK
ncbi:thiamine pyrophosphate-dependent dehydrogenase E1 component subunit alpha [Acetobacterium wieringae]|uniref:Acetoin:2,6-dichlorophenolindophenol oxidoreductase subunit alpha n=1 Tax=Acetobacterium wieringae TaxID=52694 RepID=A0A1F2PK66_9FIRM|nr:thiamine pyrophosphate-dependent dehydrogenase E1 component subunit alpha [Acetobacterium wieringae]MEA4805257.1 thiamine pyrophosphate-dependent dehydrogenase E1 component subunit alpha [Acetobacterium wieringae]OFV71779.1 acetoin:2,6-dichlorophenolindophenol oxidoreductase subunit alpha [Acetobacterium wieringae]URN83461.1 thiamine pyrophosphate-dependent dehydrogenase E1 component subunit alpha [Acetobacterium wieringae]UYO61941.1 thiamine pyrophosphate-dependent dehydrogenase E1 componen